MDLPGCFMMLVAIVLLILSLTLGASNGWSTPGFIAPLIISAIIPGILHLGIPHQAHSRNSSTINMAIS
ncbi:uncharacterized protein IAS62_002682 [Cryptococcus decagattii]|uniref:Uncharacterized protein n=1 Tax=Cryptococcus decagattii TaxID=1859122 RepID=A0ABZ2AU23_9TREE